MLHVRTVIVLVVVIGSCGMTADRATADIVLPSIQGTVRDSNNDGLGDLVVTSPPFPIIRKTGPPLFPPGPTESAILEYDVRAFQGMMLTEARLGGIIFVNNALDTGPRIIELLVYKGDGLIAPVDFHSPAASLGTVSYHPPSDGSVRFDLDVLGQLQSILDSGATHVGLRLAPLNVQAPSTTGVAQPPVLTLTGVPGVVPEPSSLALLGAGILGLGILGYVRRRRAAC